MSITLEVSADNFPSLSAIVNSRSVCALFSLLKHENKMSVLHFKITRTEDFGEPIKAKEDLIFQVGFRSFHAKPIFSEANLNCDKHKSERFLRV